MILRSPSTWNYKNNRYFTGTFPLKTWLSIISVTKSVFGTAIAPFQDYTNRLDPFNWPDAFMWWLLFNNGALKRSSSQASLKLWLSLSLPLPLFYRLSGRRILRLVAERSQNWRCCSLRRIDWSNSLWSPHVTHDYCIAHLMIWQSGNNNCWKM